MKARLAIFLLLTLACCLTWLKLRPHPGISCDATHQDRNGNDNRITPSSDKQQQARRAVNTRIRENPTELELAMRERLNLIRQHHSKIRGPKGLELKEVDRLRSELDLLDTNLILDLLRALDVSDIERNEYNSLASFIAGSLARRNPQLALDTFLPRIRHSPDGTERQLSVIYSIWKRSDPVAAASWLENQKSSQASGLLAKLRNQGTTKESSPKK